MEVIKMGCIIPRTKHHVTATHIYVEAYLRNEVMNGNKQQADHMLNELTDKCVKIHNNKGIN